jgi:ABC-type multidrug transport system fused ATPase/permease subunit
MVALVGPSGGGKSTIVNLIEHFYGVSMGEILIDGVDVKELDPKWFRKHIGIVSQEPVLFSSSIKENITFGKDDATQEEIEEVAQQANAHQFILSFSVTINYKEFY